MQGVENISTLMDGELSVDEAAREIVRLKSDAPLRENWDTYHLIGDAMRGSTAGKRGRGFTARFSERLEQEPTVLAPHQTRMKPRFTRRFQNYALSAAASVAAVAVVGWVAMSTLKPNAPAELAKAPVPQPQQQVAAGPGPAAPQPAVLPVPAPRPNEQVAAAPAERMQEYLLAHQGISPTTAIQGVTPYIRTVSSSSDE